MSANADLYKLACTRFVKANADALAKGIKGTDALAMFNELLLSIDSQAEKITSAPKLVEALIKCGYDAEYKSSRIEGGKPAKTLFVKLAEDKLEELSKSESSEPVHDSDEDLIRIKLHAESTLNENSSSLDFYAALSLYILNDDEWKAMIMHTKPRVDEIYLKTESWLLDASFIASSHNYMSDSKLIDTRNVPAGDYLKYFYQRKPSAERFVLRVYRTTAFIDFFKQVISIISINHPEWEEENKKALKKASKLSPEAEWEQAIAIQCERERKLWREKEIADSKRLKKQAEEEEKEKEKRKLEEARIEEARIEAEMKTIENIKPFFTTNQLKQRVDKLRALKPSLFESKTITPYSELVSYCFEKMGVITLMLNEVTYWKLSSAVSEFIGGDDIKAKYDKYRAPHFDNHLNAITESIIPYCNELDDYIDRETLAQFLADKMNAQVDELLALNPDDKLNNRCLLKAKREIDDYAREPEGLEYTLDDKDCILLLLPQWIELRKLELLSIPYQCVSAYVEKKYEQLKRMLNGSIANDSRKITKVFEEARKKVKQHELEVEWALAHDHQWYSIRSDDVSKYYLMEYDATNHFMYYHPNPKDETRISRRFEIASLMKEPNYKWKSFDAITPYQPSQAEIFAEALMMFINTKKALHAGGPRIEEPNDDDDDELLDESSSESSDDDDDAGGSPAYKALSEHLKKLGPKKIKVFDNYKAIKASMKK